jgi:hypothetical protein
MTGTNGQISGYGIRAIPGVTQLQKETASTLPNVPKTKANRKPEWYQHS